MIPNISRREWLTLSAAGVAAGSLSGWLDPLAAHAAEQSGKGRKHKSCVLLWMDGGPSHVETFDPKPDAGDTIMDGIKAIQTSVPGIMVGDKFPKVAGLMKHGALLRGMATEEADHTRARLYMHTGYRPGVGGITYPSLGSIVSDELGDPETPLPNFVATGTALNKYEFISDPGFRGPIHQPLALPDASQGLNNLNPAVAEAEFNTRIGILDELEKGFLKDRPTVTAQSRNSSLTRALRLIRSGQGKVFDIKQEPAKAREKYGESAFGNGCLLARRLVEANVPFVEVYLANWDTHEKNVHEQSRNLMTQVDNGLSALLQDLSDRGLLDSTLIIWMGEFGRSPQASRTGGRDHYAKAWSTALFGGGIKGGQFIGKTDARGATVSERPISAVDFMATICTILGIKYDKELTTPNGRPIRTVDKGEKVILELI